MTNINGHNIAIEDFDIDAHALAPEYFREQIATLKISITIDSRLVGGNFLQPIQTALPRREIWTMMSGHSYVSIS